MLSAMPLLLMDEMSAPSRRSLPRPFRGGSQKPTSPPYGNIYGSVGVDGTGVTDVQRQIRSIRAPASVSAVPIPPPAHCGTAVGRPFPNPPTGGLRRKHTRAEVSGQMLHPERTRTGLGAFSTGGVDFHSPVSGSGLPRTADRALARSNVLQATEDSLQGLRHRFSLALRRLRPVRSGSLVSRSAGIAGVSDVTRDPRTRASVHRLGP